MLAKLFAGYFFSLFGDFCMLTGLPEASLFPLAKGGSAFFFAYNSGSFPPDNFYICYLKYWFYNRIRSLSLISPYII